MRKFTTIAVIILGFVPGMVAQTLMQQIAATDKKVQKIKSEMDSYRRIKSETDSLLDAHGSQHNLTETAFKEGSNLAVVQFRDAFGSIKSADYYFSEGKVIYIDILSRAEMKDVYYCAGDSMIAWFRDGLAMEENSQDFVLVKSAGLEKINGLVTRYAGK